MEVLDDPDGAVFESVVPAPEATGVHPVALHRLLAGKGLEALGYSAVASVSVGARLARALSGAGTIKPRPWIANMARHEAIADAARRCCRLLVRPSVGALASLH